MQVNSINSNYTSQKQSFTGGIQSRLFNKLAKEGGDYVSLSNKIDEIASVNRPNFFLSDVIYNAKEKTAEFFLSVSDLMTFVPGMEKFKPKSFIVKGENIIDAFHNIDSKKLAEVNDTLERSYKDGLEATKEYRKGVYEQRAKVEAELKRKYDEAEGFWIDYYKSIGIK